MDSTLVVVYSHTGTAERAARLLCSQQGWPRGTIRDEHPRRGGMGNLRCVLDSLLHRHPAIRYDGPDPADFHAVVLVTPVWMYRMAGPMRTFVANHREALHHVAVIVTMGSGGASNVFAEAARLLHRPLVLTLALRQREVEDGSGTGALADFGERMQGHRPGAAAARTPAFAGGKA